MTNTTMTKDPVCGMSVNEKTALSTERDGKTSYFCSEKCRTTFLSKPAGSKTPQDKKGDGCCE